MGWNLLDEQLRSLDVHALGSLADYAAAKSSLMRMLDGPVAAKHAWEFLMDRAESEESLNRGAANDYHLASKIAQQFLSEELEATSRVRHAFESIRERGYETPPSGPELRRAFHLLAKQESPASRDIAVLLEARAFLLLQQSQLEEAVREFEWAHREWVAAGNWPAFAEFSFRLGRELLRRRNFRRAQRELHSAVDDLRACSDFVGLELLNALSEASRYLRDFGAAERASRACIGAAAADCRTLEHGIFRDNARVCAESSLGWLAWNAGCVSDARSHFESALAIVPAATGEAVVAEDRLTALLDGFRCPQEGSPGRRWGVRMGEFCEIDGSNSPRDGRLLRRHTLTQSPWSYEQLDEILKYTDDSRRITVVLRTVDGETANEWVLENLQLDHDLFFARALLSPA